MKVSICAVIFFALLSSYPVLAEELNQNSSNQPAKAAETAKYPQIVLYSVSWCPHCRAAKEYLAKNGIPYLNRDVEVDAMALQDLTTRYSSTGVPVLVFGKGDDEIVMKGFTPKLFQDTLQKAGSK